MKRGVAQDLTLHEPALGAAHRPDVDKYRHKELSERIIGCAIAVHRELGPGYLEAIYENALAHELGKQGIAFRRQQAFEVYYDAVKVREHRVDLLVEDAVVVELKSVEAVLPVHTAQAISTLKAARIKVGLLVSFNQSRLVDGIRRVVF